MASIFRHTHSVPPFGPPPAFWPLSMSRFSFEPGKTTLSNPVAPLLTCALYLVAVFGIKHIMRDRKPFDLKKVVTVYNFALSLLSGVLFFCLARELLAFYWRDGFMALFGAPNWDHSRGLICAFYYINYIFKYVELCDTMFLCLRKKQTPFIHVYHHAITLMLCWTQLTSETCLQWVIIVINLGVHILLYSYYALYEMKVEIWWKKYLTSIQIVQFMIGLTASIAGMLCRALWDFTPRAWGLGYPVTGSWSGSFFGLAVVISYLVLFVRLYNEKYSAEGKGAAGMGRPAMNGKTGGTTLFKSDARAQSAQYSSLYSPLAKAAPPAGMSASQALGLAGLTAEDQYAPMRDAWLTHELIVADRARWTEHADTPTSASGSTGGGGSNGVTLTFDEAQLRKRTFSGMPPAGAGRL